MIIGWFVMVLLSCCISCGGQVAAMGNDLLRELVNCVSGLPWLVLLALNLVLTVLQALKAKQGEWSTYPFAIRLIK